jgi:hypothetical protein
MTLTANLNVQFSASQTGTHTIAEPNFEPRISMSLAFEDGVGLNQADLQWVIERTLAAGASDLLDLTAGLMDAFNKPIVFAEIVAILITTDAENTDNLEIGAAASEAWTGIFGAATDKIKLPPGGMFAISSPGDPGIGAVDGTSNTLQLKNASATESCSFQIAIVGRTQ